MPGYRSVCAWAAMLFYLAVASGCEPSSRRLSATSWATALLARIPAVPAATPEVEAGPRADAELVRTGKSRVDSTIKGHFLWLPESFASADGQFDVVIVFHAHRPVVRESVERSGINAAIVNVNLGAGAANYEMVFSAPAAFDKLLANIPRELAERGLEDAAIRRVAVVSWSAGYGAVQRIMSQPANAERVDAAVVLDGLHVHLVPGSDQVVEHELDAYVGFAERAAAGDALFLITHNHIRPEGGKIASGRRVSGLLLDRVGVERRPWDERITAPHLAANDGVYSKRRVFDLQAETIARREGLVVEEFTGHLANDHISHLMCMDPLALQVLIDRWSGLPRG